MRLVELELLRYYAFERRPPLVLDGGPGRLELVYGPNEAGKTTCLRAVADLLFGFGARLDRDDPRQRLNPREGPLLGGLVRGGDGVELSFVRTKGQKDTLSTRDRAARLDEGALARLLGGVDKRAFEAVWGLDAERLRAGGDLLRRQQGILGDSLAAAAAGSQALHALLERLRAEGEELFSPRKNARVRFQQARAELEQARDRAREGRANAGRWLQLREEERRYAEDVDAGRRKQVELQAELAELDALQRAAERLPALDRALAALAAFGDFAGLPATYDRAARVEAETTRARALGEVEQLAKDLAETDRAREELPPPSPLLEREEELRGLVSRVEQYRAARAAVDQGGPALQAERARLEERLRAHDPGLDLGTAERLGVSPGARARLEELATWAQPDLEDLAAEVAGLAADLAQAEADLAACDAPPPPDRLAALAAAVDACADAATCDRAVHEATERARAAAEARDRAVANVPGWAAGWDALDRAALPGASDVERWAAEHAGLAERAGALDAKDDERRAELATLTEELEALRLTGAAPTEDELGRARAHREAGWVLVVGAWLEGGPPAEAAAAFAGARPLRAAYEDAVAAADGVADRMRQAHEQVARRARLEARRLTLVAQEADLARARGQLDAARAAWAATWGRAWAVAGLEAAPGPEAARGWLERVDLARRRSAEASEREGAARSARDIRAERRASLCVALAGLGRGPADAEAAAPNLSAARDLARALRDAAARQGELQDLTRRLTRDLGARRAKHADAAARRATWLEAWTAALATVGLPAEATPKEALAHVKARETLVAACTELRRQEAELAGKEQLVRGFRAEVAAAVADLGPELAEREPDAAAFALQARLTEAKLRETERADLTKRRAELAARLDAARQEAGAAEARLEQLRREAGVAALDALPARERLHEEWAAADEARRLAEAALAAVARGRSFEELRAALAGRTPEALAGERAARAAALGTLEEEQRTAAERRGELRKELEAFQGGDAAAAAEQDAASLRVELRDLAARYARVRVAAAALERLVELHRRDTENPIVARAGALFERLTAGSFAGLRTFVAADGRELLVGARPGAARDEVVELDAMSAGARDQAFLALVLAYLERRLDQRAHEPLPFVVDDVLVHFDDARASAALEVLAALAARTQVLYFTHHRHVLELARAALPPAALVVHELGA